MRPKLTDSAFYAPVEGGVFVRSLSNQAVLRGADLYRWLERLAPYLDGDSELDSLLNGVDGPRRAMIEGLLERLGELGLVRDAGLDIALSPLEAATYAPSVAYLEQFHAAPNRVFADFRATEVLVVGSGRATLALVKTLIEMGTRRVHTVTASGPPLDREVEELIREHRRQDPDCAWVPLDRESLAAIPAACPVVVHSGGPYGGREALELQRLALAQGRAFLSGGWSERGAYLGPVVAPGRPGCVRCAVTRLGAAAGHRVEANGAAPAPDLVPELLLGDLLASWVFRHLTGSPTPDRGAGLLRIDTETLAGSPHRLLPWPGCEVCAGSEPAVEAPELPPDPAGMEEFLADAGPLVDERTGILARFDSGLYEQLPVNQVEVVCRPVPFAGPAGVTVVVPAREGPRARYRAARAGLAWYGQVLAGRPDRDGWLRPDEAAPAREPADWAFVTGRTRAQWLGTGLLELGRRLTWAELQAGRASIQTRLDQVPDDELLTFVKWLRVQFGCTVEAARVAAASGLPGEAAALFVDGRPAALCVDAELDAALERALVGIVQRRQNEEHRKRTGALDWLDAPERGLVHDLPDEGVDWSSWTPAAVAACERGGLDVAIQLRAVDGAISRLGLVTGFVGISAR